MKRRVFTILSAVSLLMFVAVCVLWVRSYWVKDNLTWVRPDKGWIVASGRGLLVVNFLWFRDVPARPRPPWRFEWERQSASSWQRPAGGVVRRIGFGYDDTGPPAPGWRGGFVPHWLVAAAFAALPAAWFIRWRRQRRGARCGLCPCCGYDLRATRDRCPECGRAVAPRTNPPLAPP